MGICGKMVFLTEGHEDREGRDAFMFYNPSRPLWASVQTIEILDAWGFG
jgi:hypothetical protein